MSGASPASDEDPACAVYDGRPALGLIYDRSTGCVATDAARRPLGRFATWEQAAHAIHDATRLQARGIHAEMSDATDTELAAPDSKRRDIIYELPFDAE